MNTQQASHSDDAPLDVVYILFQCQPLYAQCCVLCVPEGRGASMAPQAPDLAPDTPSQEQIQAQQTQPFDLSPWTPRHSG